MYRNSYVEVELDKLKHNIQYFQNKSGKKMIGVLKANGYGMVDYVEAGVLLEQGVDFFAVSSLDEALKLRKHDIPGQILILGYVPPEAMDIVRENDCSIVTVSMDYLSSCDLKGVKVHLKLDTGMNRIGVKPAQAREAMDLLKEKGALVEGVMSHLSSSDVDKEYTEKQYEIFRNTVKQLDHEFKYIHISATDGSIILNDDICNYERIGLGLLGYSSYHTDLLPCVSLKSEVINVKKLEEGETVSYGRHFTSDGTGYILTIPLGYADGFYRSNTGKTAYVDGEYGIIAGSVCMDQMMIHTREYHEVGTVVELIGEHISAKDRAKELNTITYEIMTGLSERLTRVYVKDGQVVRRLDLRFEE
ncbi:MAG: alanine racemase [Erysipelotrichaceae bacterium]|nr:alanine racemase [Erysipelotrichaceae bacterium]